MKMTKKEQMEYVVWGVRDGDPDWAESVLLETTDRDEAEQYSQLMLEQGYSSTRVMTFGGERPDFIRAINI
jgi:hypothetical protein